MIEEMNIGDLADAAGISRRSVRFYIQQGLLSPPVGAGRGAHYEDAHLERLKRLLELQAAGHSLDGIRRILDGKHAAPIPAPKPDIAGKWSAELWTRVTVAEGIELHFESTRRTLDVGQLAEIRRAVLRVINSDETKGASDGTAK